MTISQIPYQIHNIESAPEKSRHALAVLKRELGFIPNVAAAMAESPVLLNAFVAVFETFHRGSFPGRERQVLLLSNAVANGCAWAVALHSTLALNEGVSAEDVDAIRARRLPMDARLRALSAYTRALNEKRGHANRHDLAAFTDAGFTHDQVLEVIVGLAGSVFTNYTGNITKPPVEADFELQAWTP
jgi:AhpD family alkylhydroperoxidase